MEQFLVYSVDEPADSGDTYVVLANSREEALTKYIKRIIALSELHRESVLDLSINVSFAERFHLASEHEVQRFTTTGEHGTEPELVRSRVRSFFSDRPDFGVAYLKYMDTEDPTLLSEEFFEFVALQFDLSELGIDAVPLRSLPVLE